MSLFNLGEVESTKKKREKTRESKHRTIVKLTSICLSADRCLLQPFLSTMEVFDITTQLEAKYMTLD